MNILQKLTQSGVSFTTSKSEARNVLMTNYISIALSVCAAFLIISRFVFIKVDYLVITQLIFGVGLFLMPVFLNRFGLTLLSKFTLCGVPPVFVLFNLIQTLAASHEYDTSDYVGLRFYLLAFSCFPFLVFNLNQKRYVLSAVIFNLLIILLYDPLLNVFNLGHGQAGQTDTHYSFTNVRAVTAYCVIAISSFLLKQLVEKNEALNEKLLQELEETNKLIQQQADKDVNQLNQKLMQNLAESSAREFVLEESQRIAKIGSWEYKIKGASLFWSDEMYNIFALDKAFELSIANFSQLFGDEQSLILIDATDNLLKYGKPYEVTLRIRTPIGYYKWLRINAFPINVEGKITGAKGICHDVTVFRESEELIRKSENRYKSLFEQASDAIMIFDFDGNILDVNAGLCEMFGYTRDELLNKKATALLDATEMKERPIVWDQIRSGDQVFTQRKAITKKGKQIDIETNVKMYAEGKIMAISRDITQRILIEQDKERTRYQLNERVKELTALYQSSRILNEEGRSIDEVLQTLVNVLPAGWQYPEITAARICVGELNYETPGFHENEFMQEAKITTPEVNGFVRVVYLEEKPAEVEGPFLQEERNLIDMIAEMIRAFVERKHEEIELSKAQANLRATINNTEILIWSVDLNFKLLTFNKAFFRAMEQYFGFEVRLGTRVFESLVSEETPALVKHWEQYYMRALTGEILSVQESAFGKLVHFSLSPIIENETIIGVSIFGDDITERTARQQELNEAHAKIGEMKLMALRSVMSPHFVFNVLNSIQFFIAKNDRLNAINYLSSFSKLIRSILSHSVSNKIKLSEELEMLTNYVQLEMARFENKFEFVLTVDPELEIDSVEIPSLLIQPYVENAILHGLYNKQEKGTLSVRVKEDDNSNIIFEIEDDGVGREEAQKIRKRNFPTHKSMGVKLTEERLRLINQNDEAALEIEDLYDGTTAIGTRVRIKIKT